MALFKWLTSESPDHLYGLLANHLASLGLEINSQVSTETQLYASDPVDSEHPSSSRLKLFVTCIDRVHAEFQFEVMSDEPMVRSGTRCELTAMALQQAFPPMKPYL